MTNAGLLSLLLIALAAAPSAAKLKDQPPAAEAAESPAESEAAGEDAGVKILDKDKAGCTWVEAAAQVDFGERDTKHQALAQAVARARTLAMNRFLGVNLRHQTLDFQQEGLKGEAGLTQSLLRVTQLGRVLKEKVVREGLEDAEGCRGCRYGACIRVCIVPQDEQSDKGFRVELTLNRKAFEDGDEAFFAATPTRDAHVYVFNVDMQGDASLIVPNEWAPESLVKAGETLTYPTDELKRKFGARIVAQLPPGEDVSAETIHVIASRQPLPPTLLEVPLADKIEKLTAKRVGAREIAESLGVTEQKVKSVRTRLGIPPEENADKLDAWRRRYLARKADGTEAHGGGTFLALVEALHREELEWVDNQLAFTISKK